MPVNCVSQSSWDLSSWDLSCEARMTEGYLAVISLIERLHRHFLDVVKLELDGSDSRDINNVQALMLFNIGDAEMTVGELTLRGCYLGSNVSYNVKKMVENGYLIQERSQHDRRSIHGRPSSRNATSTAARFSAPNGGRGASMRSSRAALPPIGTARPSSMRVGASV